MRPGNDNLLTQTGYCVVTRNMYPCKFVVTKLLLDSTRSPCVVVHHKTAPFYKGGKACCNVSSRHIKASTLH
jgi:hypothetical protein